MKEVVVEAFAIGLTVVLVALTWLVYRLAVALEKRG
jgi:hypothetical protein